MQQHQAPSWSPPSPSSLCPGCQRSQSKAPGQTRDLCFAQGASDHTARHLGKLGLEHADKYHKSYDNSLQQKLLCISNECSYASAMNAPMHQDRGHKKKTETHCHLMMPFYIYIYIYISNINHTHKFGNTRAMFSTHTHEPTSAITFTKVMSWQPCA